MHYLPLHSLVGKSDNNYIIYMTLTVVKLWHRQVHWRYWPCILTSEFSWTGETPSSGKRNNVKDVFILHSCFRADGIAVWWKHFDKITISSAYNSNMGPTC